MTLRQRLDEIRTLEQGAQKKPWYVDKDPGPFDGPAIRSDGFFVAECGTHDFAGADAALIAAMRNAIGPLLEVVEQQHRALQGLLSQTSNIEVLGEWSALDINIKSQKTARVKIDETVAAARAALSLLDKEEA